MICRIFAGLPPVQKKPWNANIPWLFAAAPAERRPGLRGEGRLRIYI